MESVLDRRVSNAVYVGNIPYGVTETELRELFSGAGHVVECRIVKYRGTDRSLGYGFVEMSTEVEALSAIAKIHGHDLHGRTLVVREADSRG